VITIAELNTSVKTLKSLVDEKTELIVDYESSKEENVEILAAAQNDVARLVEKEISLRDIISSLNMDIESKESAMESLNSQVVERETKCVELSNSLEVLIARQEESVKEAESIGITAAAEKAELEAQIGVNTAAMEELEAKMQRASEKLIENSKMIEGLELKLESTTELLSEGAIENTRIKREMEDRIGNVESDLLYKTSKLDTALFEVERLKTINTESVTARDEFDALKESYGELEGCKIGLEEELVVIRAECDKVSLDMKIGSGKLTDENMILTAEIDGLKIHNKELARRVESSVGELDALVSAADKAREASALELEDKVSSYKQLEKTVSESS
jgi:chromosome segregation ATPase